MWILELNDMRYSKIESVTPVAKAQTKEELEALLCKETVAPYKDGSWHKTFRQGGPLEWFNPPCGYYSAFVDVGTEDDWADEARKRYRNLVGDLPTYETA